MFKKNKPWYTKFIVQGRNLSSGLLYLSDNMLWLINIGILDQHKNRQRFWMSVKDSFALLKNLFGIVKSIMAYRRRSRAIHELKNLLEVSDSVVVTKDDKSFDLLKRFLLKRNKQR